MANPPSRLWQQMIQVYGRAEGNDVPGQIGHHRCGECVFLKTHRYAKPYFKCYRAKVTGGENVDPDP